MTLETIERESVGVFKEVLVSEYRNIKRSALRFSPSENVFFGDNAQGKTNLLEVIYLLATGRSFRTTRLEDIIPWPGGFPRIRGFVQNTQGGTEIEISLSDARRTASVNGAAKARLSQLLGVAQIIEILPQDILLIDGDPSRRRRFLDMGISQADERYYASLLRYHQALRQRNKALQAGFDLSRDKIRMWNKTLEEAGAYLAGRRRRAVEALNARLSVIYPGLTQTEENAAVLYKSAVEEGGESEVKNLICSRLLETEQKDINAGFTTFGPHRDDLAFQIEGQEAKSFGSEGQKRTLAIALKLALGVYLHETHGTAPVFILDDVLTQLDESRRHGLIQTLRPYQSFISVTSLEFHRDLMPQGKWFRVREGRYDEFNP